MRDGVDLIVPALLHLPLQKFTKEQASAPASASSSAQSSPKAGVKRSAERDEDDDAAEDGVAKQGGVETAEAGAEKA